MRTKNGAGLRSRVTQSTFGTGLLWVDLGLIYLKRIGPRERYTNVSPGEGFDPMKRADLYFRLSLIWLALLATGIFFVLLR
jgi:hypothetical protein